jgi:(p)ppGpp synthase/HD superfamily hydrolase
LEKDVSDTNHPVDLKIECEDRPNLVVDLMSIFSSKKVPVTSLNARYHHQNNQTTIFVTIYVPNSEALQETINILLNVKSVFDVSRIIH